MKIKSKVACLLISGIMLTTFGGCSKEVKQEEIPELIESTVTNEDSRPVVRGNIGDLTIIMTRAVPRGYSQGFGVARNISKVFVGVGDHVEEGDKIAEADTSQIDEQVKNINKLRDDLDKQIDSSRTECSRIVEGLEFDREALVAKGDTDGASEIERNILLTKENYEYQEQQFLQQKDAYDRDLEDLEKNRRELTLFATHSGYITYLKNPNASYWMEADANVALISDYDDIYLESPNINIKGFEKYRKSTKMYAVIGGKEYAVSEERYSPASTLYAQSVGKYPKVRFKVEGYTPKLGETIPIYVYEKYTEDVLMVGNDSIRSDGNKKYVFVEGSTGGMEKRDIETGVNDSIHTEVISGLSEGEKVFYLSDSIKPIDYDEITVTADDFSMYSVSDNYSYITMNENLVTIPESGKIDSVIAQSSKAVDEGDPLFKIKAEVSDAKLLEAEQNLNYARKQHEDALDRLDSELEGIDAQLDELDKAEPPAATDTDAIRDRQTTKDKLRLSREQVLEAKEYENNSYYDTIGTFEDAYNKLKDLKDSDGIVTVYASTSGTVYYRTFLYEGLSVEKGAVIAGITYGDKDTLIVSSVKSKRGGNYCTVTPGTKIEFRGNTKTYTGVCSALLGEESYDVSNYLMEERDGKTIISYNGYTEYGNVDSGFFVSTDDPDFSKETEHYHVAYQTVGFKKAIVVPLSCINSEKNEMGSTTRYFVWKVVDGELTKHFIEYSPSFVSGDVTVVLGGLSEGDIIAGKESE